MRRATRSLARTCELWNQGTRNRETVAMPDSRSRSSRNVTPPRCAGAESDASGDMANPVRAGDNTAHAHRAGIRMAMSGPAAEGGFEAARAVVRRLKDAG